VTHIDHKPTTSGKVIVWIQEAVGGGSAWRMVQPSEITDKPPLWVYQQMSLFDTKVIPFPQRKREQRRKAA
jgi:hypothetical protein